MSVDCKVKVSLLTSDGDNDWNRDRNSGVMLPRGEINGMCVDQMKGVGGGCIDRADLMSCSCCGGTRRELSRFNSCERNLFDSSW